VAKFAQREEGEKRYLLFGKKAKFWRRKILLFCKRFGVMARQPRSRLLCYHGLGG